ncbi:MAG: anaphase-promoting complex subunit cdc27 [Alyxoria varia]|nr:MAG: anaphase-promoting complex subunit cdc27 [Alyxoria varia]
MGPFGSQLSAQLRQVIWYNLDNNLLDNALFYAERLYAVDNRNPDSVHILALCHFRLGEFKAAYDTSRLASFRAANVACSYIFAQSCLALGRYTDGITALGRVRMLWDTKRNYTGKHSDSARRHIPDTAAVQCLLGKLYHDHGDVRRAVEYYVQALRLNPFMWDAFERLCNTGTNIRPSKIFKAHAHMFPPPKLNEASAPPRPQDPATTAYSGPLQTQTANPNQVASVPESDPFHITKPFTDGGLKFGDTKLMSRMNVGPAPANTVAVESNRTVESETRQSVPVETSTPAISSKGPSMLNSTLGAMEPPQAPVRKTRLNQGNQGQELARGGGATSPAHTKRTISGTNASHATQISTDPNVGPQRRSVRLFKKGPQAPNGSISTDTAQEHKKAKATGTRGRNAVNTSTVGRVVSGNRKQIPGEKGEQQDNKKEIRAIAPTKSSESGSIAPTQKDGDDIFKDSEAVNWLLDLLSKLGNGYYSLVRYQCQPAINHFNSIPSQQRETPWVMAQIGKAYFENQDYLESEKLFHRLRKLSPSRTKDMEIFSTLLWHQKNDTELAFLSHELVDAERLSPEAWCTIGNSFSLQRDHDQALKCFKRATQLQPKFAYGFTLQGHEHVSNEEYEKALLAYRRAIGADHRHYNGWYGLGRVYEKLGKYELAEKHYRFASGINPSNSILVNFIGTMLEKQGRHEAALAQYDHACALNPSSAMSRFKRARTLLRLHRSTEALDEFLVLKDMAPDEANVHFMLGRVYKMLGDKTSAIKHLLVALNLDPKVGLITLFVPMAVGKGRSWRFSRVSLEVYDFRSFLADFMGFPLQASPLIKEAMEGLEDDDDMEDEDEQMGH